MLRKLLVVLLMLALPTIAHAESSFPIDGGWSPPEADAGVDDGGAGRPAARCHRIRPAGGCCLPNDFQYAVPCPAGYALQGECDTVRGYCPMDVPDSGSARPDATVMDATAPDATVPDATVPDATVPDAAVVIAPDSDACTDSGHAPDDDAGRAGALSTADSECGCTATGRAPSAASSLLLIAVGMLISSRRR